MLPDFIFDTGFKKDAVIDWFGRKISIKIKLQAYFEEDGVTEEQKQAYKAYLAEEQNRLGEAEKLLKESYKNPGQRFVPKTLLFERDGSYALLCDDEEEPDDGVAICFVPKLCVMSQDVYL